jgi:hypothetical protein
VSRLLFHLLAALLVLAMTVPGVGYRHHWQDEIETAERARTILESGYPRVIDAAGVPSLNAGGVEIEDGAAHRATPWIQFYWAAGGLGAGRLFGLSPDTAVRLPFVGAHAATSGLVSYGLHAVAGLSPVASAAIAVALGVQTVRVVHHRTARYHALLDLGFVLGLLGVGLLATRRAAGLALVAGSILLLPHVHTFAGSTFALCVGVLATLRLVQLSPGGARASLRSAAGWIVVPGLLSLLSLVLLTRPWAQQGWATPGGGGFRSLRDAVQVGYAFWFGIAVVPMLLWRKRPREALLVGAAVAVVFVAVRLLDIHPFSNTRFYLSAIFVGLLWPVYAGINGWTHREKRVVALALAAIVLLPELVLGHAVGTRGWMPERFGPFHGIRLAWADAGASEEQALPLALAHVRKHGAPEDPVLVEYVPQFANWYLPGQRLALVPDASLKTSLNARSRLWAVPPSMPRWHVWYSNRPGGLWKCGASCDFRVTEIDPSGRSYLLASQRLGASQRMCIVASFPTEYWLNAPFRRLSRAAFRPEGTGSDVLSVAVPCDGAAGETQAGN